MGVSISQKGSFNKTLKFLTRYKLFQKVLVRKLEKYGEMGVKALKDATPKDTGKTSESWSYEIVVKEHSASIIWKNSNVNKWANIAVLIQYGHATRNGGFVQGIDYINPAMKPIFDDIAKNAWLEVTSE